MSWLLSLRVGRHCVMRLPVPTYNNILAYYWRCRYYASGYKSYWLASYVHTVQISRFVVNMQFTRFWSVRNTLRLHLVPVLAIPSDVGIIFPDVGPILNNIFVFMVSCYVTVKRNGLQCLLATKRCQRWCVVIVRGIFLPFRKFILQCKFMSYHAIGFHMLI